VKLVSEGAIALRNKTLTLTEDEIALYEGKLKRLSGPTLAAEIINKSINQDLFELLDYLPDSFVDLLFLDPPYNLTKAFRGHTFKQRSLEEYAVWLETWLPRLLKTLKETASVYVCGDWRSSAALHQVLEKYLIVRNRVTWEREKGRGSRVNWKNCSEDLWFCTASERYTFNAEAVKLKRRVIAPYQVAGERKGWAEEEEGRYRLTYPSNLWTDLTVPFWSMAENTDHPTQKPEKLLAKIVLASSARGDLILDPFLGSGTTAVVAKKLGRSYVGVERDLHYCCLAEKRLALAEEVKTIQGYAEEVFWERNSFPSLRHARRSAESQTFGKAPQEAMDE